MYICIEDDKIISIADEEPNVPSTVTVFKVVGDDAINIAKGSHEFDVVSKTVIEKVIVVDQQAIVARENMKFLADSDWIVLRHIREKFLGIETSISDEQYARLEIKRQEMAKQISSDRKT